ncbi:MAG: outer membrane lipoprotein-sorting protein [Deltaproteobacteria bacterium]|nr:outer membrane lipoprotein-sorting protein [Deltaproteobacteria bacterium]
MRTRDVRRLISCLILLLAATAQAQDDALPNGAGPSGREIYQRVIDNKLETAYFEHRMSSTDPGGSVQNLAFWSRFKDLRAPGSAPKGAVISKTVMKFTDPYDKRDTAYLFIERKGTEDEGFHYSRKRERVTRIAPAKESIFGSDFSLDDLAVVSHIDDATYQRLPDEELQGVSVWVVDVSHKPETDPAYARSLLYVDKVYNVPLRTRHWDDAGVEVKQLEIPRGRIESYSGVWIPRESTMYDLSEKTQSVLTIERVVDNPVISDAIFSPQSLKTVDSLRAGARE